MAADSGKLLPGNDQHNGGALSFAPGTIPNLNSVNYGAAFDTDTFNAVVAKKWKYRGYYYNNNPYGSDVTTDASVGTANSQVQITYAADPYGAHVIEGVGWSYSGGAPTSASLSVESPSGTGNTLYSSLQRVPAKVILLSQTQFAVLKTQA